MSLVTAVNIIPPLFIACIAPVKLFVLLVAIIALPVPFCKTLTSRNSYKKIIAPFIDITLS